MRWTAIVMAAATIALALAAADANAAELPVTMGFDTFVPYALDVLPGDTVTWYNAGGRTHTVTADDGSFDSDDVPDRHAFSHLFTTPGTYTYHCSIHRGMTGEVDVRVVTLDPVVRTAVATNSRVAVSGRTADPGSPVLVQSDTGAGFATVARATPAPDGTWKTTVTATKPALLRATSGDQVSQTRRLLVVDTALTVRVSARGIAVHVLPAKPGALVALQLHLRERFGWWAVAVAPLDRASNASFAFTRHRSAPARVVLLGRDQWTVLAVSRVIAPG